jgi:hypothetical protein
MYKVRYMHLSYIITYRTRILEHSVSCSIQQFSCIEEVVLPY